MTGRFAYCVPYLYAKRLLLKRNILFMQQPYFLYK